MYSSIRLDETNTNVVFGFALALTVPEIMEVSDAMFDDREKLEIVSNFGLWRPQL